MKRHPFSLLAAAALLAAFSGCAADERHPGVRLHRSDALYAHEDYGDPERRRRHDESQPFQHVGSTLKRLFRQDATSSR